MRPSGSEPRPTEESDMLLDIIKSSGSTDTTNSSNGAAVGEINTLSPSNRKVSTGKWNCSKANGPIFTVIMDEEILRLPPQTSSGVRYNLYISAMEKTTSDSIPLKKVGSTHTRENQLSGEHQIALELLHDDERRFGIIGNNPLLRGTSNVCTLQLRPQQRRIPAHKAIIDISTKRGSFVFYLWAAQSMGVLIALMFLPIGESLIRLQENNGTFHWRFPYRTWTPYDDFEGILYAATYVYHLFIASLQVIVVPGFDGFFIALLVQACGQFKILRDRLENLRENCRKEMQKSKFGEREERITTQFLAIHSWRSRTALDWDEEIHTSPQLELEMRTVLVDCIDHHQTILEFLEQVEEVVNPVLLTQFLCSSIIICTSAFQLTVGNVGLVKMMTMASLCFAALYEIYMFCSFADEMQVESMAVGMSAYNSQWYHSSRSFKQLLSILMLRTRKRAKITFGKFTELSLETYASIVQICYTYFTILNRLNDDKPLKGSLR
ncbi:odorant receptor coreceptor [Anabrus simplex]|uniref:odorant receptor coreceptor n=1 Tax=Anabrus simplex TaxID=316456 RepID=UPI0035A390E9